VTSSHSPRFAADSIGRQFGTRVVLRTASVWAHDGRITALLGRNGCGKSTLLRIAAGVLAPDHGVVRIDETAFTRPRLARLAALGVFYVPQDGLLMRWQTVRQHLAAIAWRFGAARRAASVDTRRDDDPLDVASLLDARPHELSAGERRRAELALALARRPRVLLADEPLHGIAPLDAERVLRALRVLADDGAAIIVTGHEVRALLDAADDIVWMTAGTTHHLGTPVKARAHDQFRREYLGPLHQV
jgi:lipopolysaccharide export system ATP-binding protein